MDHRHIRAHADIGVRYSYFERRGEGCSGCGGIREQPYRGNHEYWSNPEQFDPERFVEGRREDKSHTYAFAPYGGGVHKCIGMHFSSVMVKAVMHQLLLKYRWSIERGYELPWDHKSMPVPKDGLPVRLTRRSTLRATVRHIHAGTGRRPRIYDQRAA